LQYRTVKPFIKWAGGKSQLIGEIRKKYPQEINRYCEPFVGGGAVLLDILVNKNPSSILINDINKELINTYVQIQQNVENVIKILQKYQEKYWNSSDQERKNIYLSFRTKYNQLIIDGGDQVERASIFIFLNKTCFNGLYRVNKKGLFNVPIGSYKKPPICDSANLRTINKLMQKVEIICGDYSQCFDYINKNTFVYIDPPYRPLNRTASFTAYNENIFDDNKQITLGNFVHKISAKGAKIVISNSDPKNTNSGDNFFDNIYDPFIIKRVLAKRMINCNGNSRGNINELIISNY